MKPRLALLMFALLLALLVGQSLLWLGPQPGQGPALAATCEGQSADCEADTVVAGEAMAPVDYVVYKEGCGVGDLHVLAYPIAGDKGARLSFAFCAE